MSDVEKENGLDESTDFKKMKYEDKIKFVNAIASPLASKKLNKKILKFLRLAAQNSKKNMRIGLKDCQRHIRKGDKGLMIFAGDVSPIDVMSHMPGVCEESNIPYVYIPSQHDLALSVGFKNSCLMVLVKEDPSYKELYDECYKEMKKLVAVHPVLIDY